MGHDWGPFEEKGFVVRRFRVRYAETDAQGVVYYGTYLTYFEVGRNAFFRKMGLPYEELERRHGSFVVTEVNCSYRSPARYGDLLEVRTALRDVGHCTIFFYYQIRRVETGETVAEGDTRLALVSDEGRPKRIPPVVKEPLQGMIS